MFRGLTFWDAWGHALAVQIEGNTLTCHMMDLDGSVIQTFAISHGAD